MIKLLSISVLLLFLTPHNAFSFVRVTGDDISSVMETWHKMNNMYFYAALVLWPSSFYMLGKIRQGGQLRPFLSRTVAWTLWAVNAVCLLFFVIHFAPETGSIIDFCVSVLKRVLN